MLLKQLHSSQHSVRMNAVQALRQLTPHFVADDIMVNDKQNDNLESACSTISKWHFLNRFEDYLTRYDALMRKYLEEFSFKLTELEDLEHIDRHDAFSYLLIWDCIINVCAKSPVALRSVYTSWLNENRYEEVTTCLTYSFTYDLGLNKLKILYTFAEFSTLSLSGYAGGHIEESERQMAQ